MLARTHYVPRRCKELDIQRGEQEHKQSTMGCRELIDGGEKGTARWGTGGSPLQITPGAGFLEETGSHRALNEVKRKGVRGDRPGQRLRGRSWAWRSSERKPCGWRAVAGEGEGRGHSGSRDQITGPLGKLGVDRLRAGVLDEGHLKYIEGCSTRE